MQLTDKEILNRLGTGESISSVRDAAGVSADEFQDWWKTLLESRVPTQAGSLETSVTKTVEIERDDAGIPHIYAENDEDLFVGFGMATAWDRLFQLDYLRRKASGRLSEVLGNDGLEIDVVSRTVGLRRTAEAEWQRLPRNVKDLLEAFSSGINTVIESSQTCLPVEFDLLDYRPEVWTPIDCLAIENEFRWYLTGRFPIIVIPELAKRTLGNGPLYREFLLGEADDECIMPPGSYPAARKGSEAVGQTMSDPEGSIGSNNWVVSGTRTADGSALLASDPHIAFEAVSCWHQVHLHGGLFNVAGIAYVGIPGIMIGRNERVTWGITNNICSQRDLYQEKTDPQHPGCFLYDGDWELAREVVEEIPIKGSEPVKKTIRFSRNGPIVDEILPSPGNETGPVALKWLGHHHGGWLEALLNTSLANSAEEFRDQLHPWHVPTFSLVFADVDGHIGLKVSGRLPIRKQEEKGYRPGWDPDYQWEGLIPFESMPAVIDPQRGWMASANNRLADNDFPYPLDGRWTSGNRMRRIRNVLEGNDHCTKDNFRDLQQDSLSLRAVQCVPSLVEILSSCDESRMQAAVKILKAWDCRSEPQEVGPTLFNVFFTHWSQTVAGEHFDSKSLELLSKGCEGIAARLLHSDTAGWFQNDDREKKIIETFLETLDLLTTRFGSEMQSWTWSRLHTLPLKHVLSGRGDLSQLLDHAGAAVRGDMTTVCNTGCGPDWDAVSGAGYRMITELGSSPPGIWAIDVGSQSGHPGSPHYGDQFGDWSEGRYRFLSLDREEASHTITAKFSLRPRHS